MDVLIGSKGYIGSHLSSNLTERLVPFMSIPSRDVFYQNMELLHDQDIRTVYWCAASFLPNSTTAGAQKGIPEFEFLCNSVKKNFPHANIVLLSTNGLVDYKLDSQNESPRSIYFENRFRYEQTLAKMECPGVVLRISNVYGPNVRSQYGVIANWTRNILRKQPIIVTDSLNSFRDYIYISDVVDAILAANRVVDGQILDVGCGSSVSLSQLMALFNEILDFRVEYLTDRGAILASRKPKLRLASTQSAIGWSPRISLREGLKLTFKNEGLL